MRLICLESPYAGDIPRNLLYARSCMAHAIAQGDAPIASHLLYTQEGILRDEIKEERLKGIVCGFAWMERCDAVVLYADLGISPGMQMASRRAKELGKPVEIRYLREPGAED